MKTFIYKTNQFLLERYPTVWNTRLVWMMLTAIVLHLAFFVFGFFTLHNPEILQERSAEHIFFNNGSIFLSIIISVLLLVAWLIYMFKNNAFKNFYPTTKLKLFGQFFSYIVIILVCTSFYLSYQYGIKAFISYTYPDAQINKEIEISNDAALFFSEDISDYTLDKRRFPKPFYELFCEERYEFIDLDKSYLSFEDENYQFYALRTETAPLNAAYSQELIRDPEYASQKTGYVFSKVSDSIRTFYFKDSVVDVHRYVKTTYPSYYNMSETFFISINDTLDDLNYYLDYNHRSTFTIRDQLRNQRNYELLNRNDKTEIKQLLDNFLNISNSYGIKHNLTTDVWFSLIYHPTNFEVKNFIKDHKDDELDYTNNLVIERTKSEEYYFKRITSYYYENNALSNVFENIESIKASHPIETIHLFMWISFFLTCIIFMFRITGLKHLLFSVITVGVLILLTSLLAALLYYLISDVNDNVSFIILYYTLFLSTLILLIPLLFYKRIKKIIVSICLNISIIGFPLYLFLILGIISMHQSYACQQDNLNNYKVYYDCDTILDSLEIGWSWLIFFAAIVFIFFYSNVIKRWKSLPEG